MNQRNLSLKRRRPSGITLSSYRREQLIREVRDRGETAVMVAAGVSRIALARAAAGLGVRAGTAALVERGLERLAAEARESADRDLAEAEDILSRRGMP